MSTVTLYGASDDLIEVEGDAPGCDEYNGEDEHFVLVGDAGKVRVRVWYTRRGVPTGGHFFRYLNPPRGEGTDPAEWVELGVVVQEQKGRAS